MPENGSRIIQTLNQAVGERRNFQTTLNASIRLTPTTMRRTKRKNKAVEGLPEGAGEPSICLQRGALASGTTTSTSRAL